MRKFSPVAVATVALWKSAPMKAATRRHMEQKCPNIIGTVPLP